MDYREIPRFPHAAYEVDVQWPHLEDHLSSCEGLDLNPDFQREHVWTMAQQTAYIEFCLRGGEVGRTIIVNAPEWEDLSYHGATLVDGKQRLEAIRKFMRDEVLVFGGHKRSEITGNARIFMNRIRWRVVSLKTRDDVLDFYLSINSGGTPHTAEEITRVRAMVSSSGIVSE